MQFLFAARPQMFALVHLTCASQLLTTGVASPVSPEICSAWILARRA